jgi:glycosyltransferase involved in cell wall biosynthesis
MPKVSVIIPTHNRAKLLRLAVTSVLRQTYRDFEIVVVDDASQDNTHEVVDSFDEARIKYVHHVTAKGDGAARNTGILNTGGAYVAFLDDDDQWLPEKLELQVAVLESSPAHVGGVYTGNFGVKAGEGTISSVSYPTRRGDLSQYALLEDCVITSCVMLRRECFKRVGLFDESIPYCNDRDMWIRIAKQFHFEYIEKPLVKYLIHQEKLSNNFGLSIKGREMILQKYRDEFSSHRRAYADRYLTLGQLYCCDGDAKKGREAFVKSIKIYPFAIRFYCHYVLSLLGARNFSILRESIAQFLAPVREKKVEVQLRRCVAESSDTK